MKKKRNLKIKKRVVIRRKNTHKTSTNNNNNIRTASTSFGRAPKSGKLETIDIENKTFVNRKSKKQQQKICI